MKTTISTEKTLLLKLRNKSKMKDDKEGEERDKNKQQNDLFSSSELGKQYLRALKNMF